MRDRPESRFVKGLLSAGAVGIEVAGYDGGVINAEGVGSCILRGMLKIQSWLAEEGHEEK